MAASDYSGDIAGDDKILARVVDGYRRIRNTLRFLLANTSDFDPAKDAVPLAELLEIDRYALARAAQFQAEILAHYKVYEFHPVVAKLQVYCSEDLGAFYLDILKDRLYTTAPKSLARRSAQTALWHITPGDAALDGAVPELHRRGSVERAAATPSRSSPQTYSALAAPDAALLAKWTRIREIRDVVNKDIEALRAEGRVGSSLQAGVALTAAPQDHALLASLGDDLKFVFITSAIELIAGRRSGCGRYGHYRPQMRALLALARRRRPRRARTRRSAAAAPATCTAPAKCGASPDGRAAPRAGGAASIWPWLGLALLVLHRRPVHQDADPRQLPAGRQHRGHQLLQHRARAQHRARPSPSWPMPRAGSAGCLSASASRPRCSSSGC